VSAQRANSKSLRKDYWREQHGRSVSSSPLALAVGFSGRLRDRFYQILYSDVSDHAAGVRHLDRRWVYYPLPSLAGVWPGRPCLLAMLSAILPAYGRGPGALWPCAFASHQITASRMKHTKRCVVFSLILR